ncbi:hypothetical protein D3C85_1384130 [compost metagenome]
MRTSFCAVFFQSVKIQSEFAVFAIVSICPVGVFADIKCDVVIIDGIVHKPIVLGVAIFAFRFTTITAVGNTI